MSLLLWPALTLLAGWWAERTLLKMNPKAGCFLPLGLLVLTVVWYLLSERQRGLAGFAELFYALLSGCGLLGTGLGWLTEKVEEGEGGGKGQ